MTSSPSSSLLSSSLSGGGAGRLLEPFLLPEEPSGPLGLSAYTHNNKHTGNKTLNTSLSY